MAAWQKHKRKGGQSAEPTSLVAIRREAIAFNAHFVATAGMGSKARAVVSADIENRRLGFEFLDGTDDEDSFALTSDGGSAKGGGRMIQVASLMRENEWIRAVALQRDESVRRFKPIWASAERMWVIYVAPAFEVRVSDRSEIASDVVGIYRYLRGDEVIYIGKGQIRSRARAADRIDWEFDVMEYSIVPDESLQTKWEAFWLDKHLQKYGKLPFHNRIGGARLSAESE